MKKYVLFLVLVIFVNMVSAGVFINEVESNPAGSDSGNEWVEIYNDGSSINLTGWFLVDEGGENYSFPEVVLDDFFVLVGLNGLVNNNENLSLFNEFGTLIDSTGDLDDNANDDQTRSRQPDGTGDFVLKNSTEGFPNQEIEISNKAIDLACVVESDNVTLSVDVDAFCIDEVTFSILLNDSFVDFLGVFNGANEYIYVVDSSLFSGSEFVNWTVSVRDCFNRTVGNGEEEFFVNSRTVLNINPISFDGLEGWFVTEPVFSLINLDAGDLFYQWDSAPVINYVGSFNLDDIPNAPPKESAGILELNYFSDVCFGEENQEEVLHVDLVPPIGKNHEPEPNSTVSDLNPLISVLLDDIYQGNSGIDLGSIVMKVDGFVVDANVSSNNPRTALVSFEPTDSLGNGEHTVEVVVKDVAGHESTIDWKFEIFVVSIETLEMNIIMPEEGIFESKRINFNITLNREIDELGFIDLSDSRLYFKRLCRDCDQYGFDRKRFKSFRDGGHVLSFLAFDQFGDVLEKNISFVIDTKEPKFRKISPRKGFSDGNFHVQFDEVNPINLTIFFGVEGDTRALEIDVESFCVLDRRYECDLLADLIEFDGHEIMYWYSLEDVAGNIVMSREASVEVDFSDPVINFVEFDIDKRRVDFMINVTEKNLDVIEYKELGVNNARWRRLCTRLEDGICERTRSFRIGDHNLTIRAVDKVKLFDEMNVSFSVIG